MTGWNSIYQKEGNKYVSRINDWNGVIDFFKKNKVKTIIDLGCGNGEHLFELARLGFKVSGFDISEEAIKLAREKFRENNLKGDFVVGSMHDKLPFKDNQFDALICLRTLNHGTKTQVQETINEIFRVINQKGFVFVNSIKIFGKKNIIGKSKLNQIPVEFIAPYTYKPLVGKEIGITHYLFNKNSLLQMFKKFKPIKFWLDIGEKHWEKYFCLLAQKN